MNKLTCTTQHVVCKKRFRFYASVDARYLSITGRVGFGKDHTCFGCKLVEHVGDTHLQVIKNKHELTQSSLFLMHTNLNIALSSLGSYWDRLGEQCDHQWDVEFVVSEEVKTPQKVVCITNSGGVFVLHEELCQLNDLLLDHALAYCYE